jgi:hypothetical protein
LLSHDGWHFIKLKQCIYLGSNVSCIGTKLSLNFRISAIGAIKEMNNPPRSNFFGERMHFGAVAREIREEQAVCNVNLIRLRKKEQFRVCRSQLRPLTFALMDIMTQISV